mgnify:CR=1 FL=1
MTNLSKGGTIPKRMNKNEFEKIRGISPKLVKCVLCGEEMKLSDGIFKHECDMTINHNTYKLDLKSDPNGIKVSVYTNSDSSVKTELVSFENICLKSSPSECYISVFKNSSLLYSVFNLIYDESDLKRAGLLSITCDNGSCGDDNNKESKVSNVSKQEVTTSSNNNKKENQEEKIMTKLSESINTTLEGFDLKKVAGDLGVKFGVDIDPRIKSTLLGTVVEYEEGRYRGLDLEKKEITDYAEIKTVSLPAIALPATTVKVGELIVHGNEIFFITKSEANEVWGANPLTAKEEKILPVLNPLGMKCYTRIISLGELLGFKGGSTQNEKIVLWILTVIGKKFFEGGVDVANVKIKSFANESQKYLELLLPFACVAFASYAMKGTDLRGKDIAGTVEKTFGIKLPKLNDQANLKRLMGFGVVIGGVITILNRAFKVEDGKEEMTEAEAKSLLAKLYKIVKPHEKAIKNVLPLALAICAVVLFKGETLDTMRDKLEGVLLIAKDKVTDEYNVSDEVFEKENVKKYVIIAGVAVVAFFAYGKMISKEGSEENKDFTSLLTLVAPAAAIIVVFSPKLKEFLLRFLRKDEIEVEAKVKEEKDEHVEPENSDVSDMFDDMIWCV